MNSKKIYRMVISIPSIIIVSAVIIVYTLICLGPSYKITTEFFYTPYF